MNMQTFIAHALLVIWAARVACAQPVTLAPAPAGVEVTRLYGIEFVTVNPQGASPLLTAGIDPHPVAPARRHAFPLVSAPPAPFRIARTELTTASWAEFLNTFTRQYSQNDLLLMDNSRWSWMVYGPTVFGGARVPVQGGVGFEWYHGFNGRINTSLIAVQGVSLLQGAMYCNWLQAGRPNQLGALLTGAYDLTEIVNTQGGILRRSPGAQFFIPSLDEWIVAAHFDPNRHGPGQPGYWDYSITSDAAPLYGPPGIGQANAGFDRFDDGFEPGDIGLSADVIAAGSYPTVQSPWGLFDTAGGAREMLETLFPGNTGNYVVEGSGSGATNPVDSTQTPDHLGYLWGGDSLRSGSGGIRIAMVVPAPAAAFLLGGLAACQIRRRR